MTAEPRHLETIHFQGWEWRPTERKLHVDGHPVPIHARATELLAALVERQGQTVSRRELLDTVWGDLAIEENNLSVQIGTLRKLLGRDTIMTVPGLGYRLTAPPGPRPSSGAPTALLPREPGNLPVTAPTLLGRDADIAALTALLAEHRLVSVVGTGGIGKTRLAQATAHRLKANHADGVWMVELSALAAPELLPSFVAQSLGTRLPGKLDLARVDMPDERRREQAALDEVVEALRDARALLVMDNCEHVLKAAARFARAVFGGTRHVRILATSQEILKLGEERTFRPPPLSVPAEGEHLQWARHGAVQLLVTRVQELQPRFEVGPGDAADAAEICRRLDGLPLAIELAAARVPLLGLRGVRARLDERFNFLTRGQSHAPPRQETLRQMMAWSHGLLDADERAVFRRAGVFAGSFGLASAERVLGDDRIDRWAVLEVLGALVDKSLLVVDIIPDEEPRYRLLESARLFALERLAEAGEQPDTLRRHAHHVAELFETSLSERWTCASQVHLRRHLPDLDNGRAALAWAWAQDRPLYVALAGAMAWLFGIIGHGSEGREHCRLALESVDASTPPRHLARLHGESCALARDQADATKLVEAQRAVSIYREIRDAALLYSALGRLAITAALCNESETGEQAVHEMASLFEPSWGRLAEWELLNAQDYVANMLGDMERGEALAGLQMQLAREVGDTYKLFFAMMATEQCVAARGHYAQAVELGRTLVALARTERYVEKLRTYISNLSTALMMCGRLDEALQTAREAAAMDKLHGSLWESLDALAMLAYKDGRHDDAARVLGCSDAANEWRARQQGHGKEFRQPVERNVRNQLVALLESGYARAHLDDLRAQGRALTEDAAAAIALGR